MSSIHEVGPASISLSEEEKKKVRDQLNRLLETHHFKNSRRYPALLSFIVEETLEGRGEYLKERLLGIKVFDRPADYDTASDPVVRVTIAEIRKRIAQYYHDEEHDSEIRIELLPGRYAPEFRWRNGRRDAETAERSALEAAELHELTAPALPPEAIPTTPLIPKRASRRRWYIAAAFALLGLGALAYVPIQHWLRPSALEVFWSPFLGTRDTILFCIPTDVGKNKGGAFTSLSTTPSLLSRSKIKGSSVVGPTFLDYESLGQNVVYSDMLATLRIANVFAIHRREYRVRLNVSTSLEDLRQGPTVLIGGMDNQWTMRVLAPLRFHFEGSDEEGFWITDTKNPGFKDWFLDLKQLYMAVNRDYAIVAHLHNEQTGQPEVIVAGIGMSGTAAAGEFIADERHVEELRRKLGADFNRRDYEVILSTDVVNGVAGAAKIIAVTSW